jgi:geranylgeranyl pyrophosphate synthase
MKSLAISPARPLVLEALERALAVGGASALDPAVPLELWQRALAGPASDFLARSGKGLRSALVRAAWQLGGGEPSAMPDNLPLVLELLHAGSLIVDDVEDGSNERRGAPTLHRVVGVPLAINTGCWMYFWALGELVRLRLPPATELAAHQLAVSTLVRCHQGQALDLSTRIIDLDAVHATTVVATITQLKTGGLCRLSAELAALAAGAEPATRTSIARFAETVGSALQMLDDLGSLTSPARRDKGREDLRASRPTWPWAWLSEGPPFAWSRCTAWARKLGDDDAAVDALADALAAEVEDLGRARVHSTLTTALDYLTAALGPSPVIDALATELRRMEASYG